jgi:hypothetical protein
MTGWDYFKKLGSCCWKFGDDVSMLDAVEKNLFS